MHDSVSTSRILPMVTPQVATTTKTGTGVDKTGVNAVLLMLYLGVGGITFDSTNKIEFAMQHSDDDSTYTACADSDILGATGTTSGIVKSLVAAHAAAATYLYGYRGTKKYVRMVATFSGTHGTGTAMSIAALFTELDLAPYVA